jgi:hypothetical protein
MSNYYNKLVFFLSKLTNKLFNSIYKVKKRLDYEKYILDFGHREDDITIVTFPKSGTTLTQLILYQLLTDGNMDFNHIYDVSPWIRNDAFEGISPRKLEGRRIIKSHDYYSLIPPDFKGKIIYVYRDGMDVAVSQYHQKKNYNNKNLTFDEHLTAFFSQGPMNWFNFNINWFKNARGLDILYLSYEELTQNKENAVKKIVDFCKIDDNEVDMDRVISKTSFSYMKEHEDKFGDLPPKETKIYDEFIRKGKSGEGNDYFDEKQKKFFNTAFKQELEQLKALKIN